MRALAIGNRPNFRLLLKPKTYPKQSDATLNFEIQLPFSSPQSRIAFDYVIIVNIFRRET